MGLFKKKPDPIAERARALNEQIAALETEIHKLARQQETAAPAESASYSPFAAASSAASAATHGHPRLRSTARPRSPAPVPPPPASEPLFEEVNQDRIKSGTAPPPEAPDQDLGVRKNGLAWIWERLRNQFHRPVASNPKLVHYLSAGSIQGLRPLRYEKRVARNRFIALAVFFLVVLGGLLSIFFSRR
jgi:hypothetical protein